MPIYAYRCSSCGHEQDVLQKISDAPLTVCPACGQSTYVKQVTAAGFQLKGSGWYVTDFRNNGTKSAPAAGKSTESKESGGGTAAAETSTAAPAAAPAITSTTSTSTASTSTTSTSNAGTNTST